MMPCIIPLERSPSVAAEYVKKKKDKESKEKKENKEKEEKEENENNDKTKGKPQANKRKCIYVKREFVPPKKKSPKKTKSTAKKFRRLSCSRME